ncbi:flavodoxin family protein [Candidatus Aerophobetes bacterium]|uniref:Flavodoxin family protein n=1 Tax=Aerophobetes bacterium TaxID=2030807 RepID=A0A523RTX8_UNCAE|nr:MAG: flavodoxin family protein [Candidatus Aerophobetes bacterium]
MKVLGLFGSPRRGGNTDLLLEEMLRGAQSQEAEIEKIFLSDWDISGCRECRRCEIDGNCVIQDQMQKLYPKLLQADYIILASPIFFYGVTAQAKRVIDRCQALWARKYILKEPSVQGQGARRKGWFISVAGSRGEKVFQGAILTARYFFDALNVEYAGELTFGRIDSKGAIKKHPSGLKEAFEAGQRLVTS